MEGCMNNFSRKILEVTSCMCHFLAWMWMHGTCICLYGLFDVIRMVFPTLIVVSTLYFHFLDSHGVMGFILGWSLGCRKFFEPDEVVSRKYQGLGLEMVLSRMALKGGSRHENSLRYGEEIMSHPSLVRFCDLETSLGEIMIAWGWR